MRNPYSFKPYLEAGHAFNDYEDNPFVLQLIKYFTGEEWPQLHEKLQTLSGKTSYRWRSMVEMVSHPDNHPTLQHYDAYNRRIDRIVRPEIALQLEKEMFSEKLFSKDTSPWEKMTKRFLMSHNDEAGMMCPLTCTDGLVTLLRKFREEGTLSEPLEDILLHCSEGIDGDFGIGAQFLTEIQGGSDVPANILKAVPAEDGTYRLYGNKFFCSAIHADYSVVTARTEDTDEVALFIVPSWLPGDKEKEKRNGTVINRLKYKMGTKELATAEIDYEGAVAYPVGSPEKGVTIAVGVVLTRSRLDIGVGNGAGMIRAAREALLYSSFREVFGKKIYEFPMASAQLKTLEETAKRTTAGAFKVYSEYLNLAKQNKVNDEKWKKKQFELRELILLQKIGTSKESVDMTRLAISLLGGNGIIEDFSFLPRQLRNEMVNELWEGPRNVLLAQIHRDLRRASSWYDPHEFVSNLLLGKSKGEVDEIAQELKDCLSASLNGEPNDENILLAQKWENVCEEIFKAYQKQALAEVPDAPLVKPEILRSLQGNTALKVGSGR